MDTANDEQHNRRHSRKGATLIDQMNEFLSLDSPVQDEGMTFNNVGGGDDTDSIIWGGANSDPNVAPNPHSTMEPLPKKHI